MNVSSPLLPLALAAWMSNANSDSIHDDDIDDSIRRGAP